MNKTCLRTGLGVISLALFGCTDEVNQSVVSLNSGVTGAAFYAEGELYRTVGTPTDFKSSAPEASLDTIYALGGLQPNVADAAPGMPGYNGGRWMVHRIVFDSYEDAVARHDSNSSGDFDYASEIEAAIASGDALDLGIVRRFECPVIKLPAN